MRKGRIIKSRSGSTHLTTKEAGRRLKEIELGAETISLEGLEKEIQKLQDPKG